MSLTFDKSTVVKEYKNVGRWRSQPLYEIATLQYDKDAIAKNLER